MMMLRYTIKKKPNIIFNVLPLLPDLEGRLARLDIIPVLGSRQVKSIPPL